jgi:integrase
MPATIYQVTHPKPMWQVVYRDHTQTPAKRVRKHFTDEAKAREYLTELNRRLRDEGTAGIAFDALLRADAVTARQTLDGAGLMDVKLTQLAVWYRDRSVQAQGASRSAAQALKDFLHEKEWVEGCALRTVRTLKNRLEKWLDTTGIATVEELTRQRMEQIRLREGVGAQTRRNDMAAVSVWCTWLLDKGWLPHHPLKGLRRPKLPPAKKQTFTAEETGRLLQAAKTYLGGKWLGTLAVMVWTGCRPSEVEATRLAYGRDGYARIEGGKLKGRANRTVPLNPAARAWLDAAGRPLKLEPINSKARRRIAEAAGLKWTQDVTRHTYISNRLALVKNDAQVAQEAGTSQEMIHRHYHALKLAKEARAWAALRP